MHATLHVSLVCRTRLVQDDFVIPNDSLRSPDVKACIPHRLAVILGVFATLFVAP
jgi:hypothetical protein